MNLEHELRTLPIAFPDEPDLAPRVLARLERPVRRWWLVPTLAALAVAGALLAIPQTRAAILDLFRIGGVEVRRVETQPRAPVRPAVLGREVSLATARRSVDFPLLVPRDPFTAYVDGPMVNLRWKRLENPAAYLHRCVVNRSHDLLRRRRVEQRFWRATRDETSELGADEMGDALAALPPQRRTAVVLRYYAGLSEKQIAEVMGVRPGTVKSMVHRAMGELRRVIER